MSSELCIIEWLLRDPSRVDEAFNLGLSIDMFRVADFATMFAIIVRHWYDFYARPPVRALKAAGYSPNILLEPGTEFDEVPIYKVLIPTFTLEEAIRNVRLAYAKKLIMQKVSSDHHEF